MRQATLTLKPTAAFPKPAREAWRAAYAMARRMIRQRDGVSTGAALTWYLDHGFRRFGYAALPAVRAAGWAVFGRRHVSKAATGTAEELARQGMLTRCISLERAPRGGWWWAWTHDPLAAANLNRGHRVHLARQRREERAALLAQLEAEDRLYVLTDLGNAALVAAGLAADRIALSRRQLRVL